MIGGIEDDDVQVHVRHAGEGAVPRDLDRELCRPNTPAPGVGLTLSSRSNTAWNEKGVFAPSSVPPSVVVGPNWPVTSSARFAAAAALDAATVSAANDGKTEQTRKSHRQFP